jgi:hypothetical protein
VRLGSFACVAIIVVAASCQPASRSVSEMTSDVRGKSWSVFLVCDPAWLKREAAEDLLRLYNAYLSVVVAANENHVPLWPFRDDRPERAAAIDPSKGRQSCDALRLKSENGPFVIVTTQPPDSVASSSPRVSLGFGDRRASEITTALMALSERVMDEHPSRVAAGSTEWWEAWKRISRWMDGRFPGVRMSVQP